MSLFNSLMDFVYDTTIQMLDINPSTNPQYIAPLDLTESVGVLKDPHTNYIFYLVSFADTDINKQLEITSSGNSNSALVTQTTKYVRNLKIDWQLYGDDAFEWSDTLRIKLFSQSIKDLFKSQGISLITDVSQAVFVPEKINNQWYKRYDISAKFNQLVISTTAVPAISGTDVIIETEKGVVSQCSASVQ
jgi:hypothetical protein